MTTARRILVPLGLATAVAIAASACASAPATSAPTHASPSAAPASAGLPVESGSMLAPSPPAPRRIIVTFRVGPTEEFRVLLVKPDDIMVAHELLAGGSAPTIPNGRLVRGTNAVNSGHAWSLDPTDFTWSDVTTEHCDGLPSAVDEPSWTLDRYCPWSARVIAIALAEAPTP